MTQPLGPRPESGGTLAASDCGRLVMRRKVVSGILTGVLFALYGGFLGAAAWAPELLSDPLPGAGGSVTVGIALATGVILASWAINAAYVCWANGPHERELRRLRQPPSRGA